MKKRNSRTLLIALALALAVLALAIPLSSWEGQASDNQIECESKSKQVKAVTSPGVHGTNVSFSSNPSYFDPTPLLRTTINVEGNRPTCLIAHFSAMAQPQDNWVVFQVRVDGVPMEGHAPGLGTVAIPVVFDPDESGAIGPYRMVAYNFFAEVGPGEHMVEVLFAGCCSSIPTGSGAGVVSPVLKLQY